MQDKIERLEAERDALLQQWRAPPQGKPPPPIKPGDFRVQRFQTAWWDRFRGWWQQFKVRQKPG